MLGPVVQYLERLFWENDNPKNTYFHKWPIWPIYDFWSRLLFFVKKCHFPLLQVKEWLLSHQGCCRPQKKDLEWKTYVKQGAGGVNISWQNVYNFLKENYFAKWTIHTLRFCLNSLPPKCQLKVNNKKDSEWVKNHVISYFVS